LGLSSKEKMIVNLRKEHFQNREIVELQDPLVAKMMSTRKSKPKKCD
jgi:hypothetical protein